MKSRRAKTRQREQRKIYFYEKKSFERDNFTHNLIVIKTSPEVQANNFQSMLRDIRKKYNGV